MEELKRCTRWIKNDKLRAWTEECLQKAPDYFWKIPASSTGKYHPEFAQGEGGLVRHTRVAVYIALQLFDLERFTPLEEDIAISALILHDTCKHGLEGADHTVSGHGKIAQELYCSDAPEGSVRWKVGRCIASHMGNWDTPRPSDELEWFVHLCDFLASRKWAQPNLDKINC